MCTASRRAILFVLAAAALVTAAAHATDRYYQDQTVTSPNGHWSLAATSPDNAGERPKPFAKDFTYVLRDTRTDEIVWERRQEGERSPLRIFLDDRSRVVIRTSLDELIALEPLTGVKTVEFNILDEIPAEEKHHIQRSTAGRMWAGRSRWGFLEHQERTYFVIRAWWDRRIIADLTRREVVRKPDAALLAACDEADRRWVMTTLEKAGDRVETALRDKDYQYVRDVLTALHLASRVGAREVVPHLRALERSSYVGSSTATLVTDVERIDPHRHTDAAIRQFTHRALRKLGEKPAEVPCTWFPVKGPDGWAHAEIPALPVPRAERVDLVKVGMSPEEVLATIGAPDCVRRSWEYDMDVETPYTLIVGWEGNAVGRIERMTPALWERGDSRGDQVGGW